MQSGYYSAAGGMVTQFNRLDSIANNLANVNTAGFKRDNNIVGDFLRLYKDARDELPLENNTKEGAQFYNRSMDRVPQITDRYTDFSLGNMAKTDNPLDFSLSQETLFFAVNTPNGIRLTKDGSFILNDEGILVLNKAMKFYQVIILKLRVILLLIPKIQLLKQIKMGNFITVFLVQHNSSKATL